ncbi:ABC transporter ATP-binding protein [Bradyrhizobium tropiciagri]|uniref:ABC transporter ATP-binding protein n=1 Tax=Bradyrhizobium tropiciagri TaxID=312253 RepID=UPI001BA44F07|nr:ABC transporter ATP-binding protein [Bradyrhizobium tropiciagri]MBR0873223.1 ABC transporter ATP-binding protein [Bradyrhizobium tropiciagri]
MKVNDDVSFSVAEGDRVALIGPNGAGKTTLINVISGDLQPSEGCILVGGVDMTTHSIPRRVDAGLIRTFQITRLFTSLTVAENVALAVMQKKGLTKRVFSSAIGRTDIRREWQRVLGVLDIAHLADRQVSQLAYGQQRLLDLAIGLALEPKVLLLDEPAAGVPSDESSRIIEAIDRLPAHIAVLMIEHDMDLVFRFARRVLVLANGRLIFQGNPAEVTSHQEVRRAYLGSYADACHTH